MNTFVIFIIGVLSGIVFMLFVGIVYALRNPNKLRKPIEDFQNRKQNKEYQNILNHYERGRKAGQSSE